VNLIVIWKNKLCKNQKKGNEEDFRKASPYHLLQQLQSKDIPPIIGVHGDRDALVPLQDAKDFYALLKKKRLEGGDNPSKDVFCVVPGAHHAFNFFPSRRAFDTSDYVFSYLDNLRAKSKL